MKPITISSTIKAPVYKVWDCWTRAEHITKWNFASEDWHCPDAQINLIIGGEFHYTMAAKDNSMQFDFWGTFKEINVEKSIDIVLGDGRKWTITLEEIEHGVLLTEIFEPEKENPIELQQAGWQMILDNFKKHVEVC
jgi:uncharacterized protein YndB with AHSA1/START domain